MNSLTNIEEMIDIINMIKFFVSKKYFDTFFITQKQLRKLKLEKINGSRKDL
jgi:hypothetical protein